MEKLNNIHYEELWYAVPTDKIFNLCQVLESKNWKIVD